MTFNELNLDCHFIDWQRNAIAHREKDKCGFVFNITRLTFDKQKTAKIMAVFTQLEPVSFMLKKCLAR